MQKMVDILGRVVSASECECKIDESVPHKKKTKFCTEEGVKKSECLYSYALQQPQESELREGVAAQPS